MSVVILVILVASAAPNVISGRVGWTGVLGMALSKST